MKQLTAAAVSAALVLFAQQAALADAKVGKPAPATSRPSSANATTEVMRRATSRASTRVVFVRCAR